MPTPKTKKTSSKAKPASSKSVASKPRVSPTPRKSKTKPKTVVAKASTDKTKNVGSKSKSSKTKTSTTQTKVSSASTVKGLVKAAKGKQKTASKKSSKTIITIQSSAKEAAKSLNKNIEPHALNDEMNEKVRELIHLSREQGFLTYKDVDKALPEIATQPEELQNVISIFNNLEIKLLDSAEVDKFKKKKEESEEESARSNQSDMLDDPVRMYLK